jgi:hypothetical protein
VTRISGDRFAGEWPREQFRKHGIMYEPSEKPKSVLYRDLLPLLNSGRVELLDHPRSVAQLCGLERRTARAAATPSIMRPARTTIWRTRSPGYVAARGVSMPMTVHCPGWAEKTMNDAASFVVDAVNTLRNGWSRGHDSFASG